MPQGLEEDDGIHYEKERLKGRQRSSKRVVKDKNWVLHKKELYRSRGKETPLDSKFTARKRRPKF